MNPRLALLALAAASALPLAAQPLTVTCGKLLDPGSRATKTNIKIFLEGGRVTRLDSGAASAPTPSSPSKKSESSSSSHVLDLSAYTCLPGLIDAHTHLLLQGDATAEE